MNEPALAAFCSEGKYEEAVVGLAALAKVPINVADRLIGGDRPDPVLILCKAAGLSWATVKAIFLVRPNGKGTSSQGLDEAFANYGGCRRRQRSGSCVSGRYGRIALILARRFSARRYRPSTSDPAEHQKTRCALFACRLGMIARRAEARPRLAPIVGALRRPTKSAERNRRSSVQAA